MAKFRHHELQQHAEVFTANGVHLGQIEQFLDLDRIQLSQDAESKAHLIPLSWVGDICEQRIILIKNLQEVQETWIEIPQ
ncbi:DUF2171 domain-containing protein [Acinetobacter indicus]|uniref:DUF2171 domain-containing protein n=1 Tax=Acinetobacter indicus TaxID=756892 RepID=UPI0012E12B37|nr:DUF2171 domain-containing protein [Acinetobacter indicus]